MRKGPNTGYVPRGKYIEPSRVPFQELLPLKLKNSVSGKSDKSVSASCVQEMSLLFACLKTNGYNETACDKEVREFQKCWSENAAQERQRKMLGKQGLLVPGEKRLSHRQVCMLLKRFPGK